MIPPGQERAAVVGREPGLGAQREEVCIAVQTMLAEITGTQVKERCDRSGDRPRCCFELTPKA